MSADVQYSIPKSESGNFGFDFNEEEFEYGAAHQRNVKGQPPKKHKHQYKINLEPSAQQITDYLYLGNVAFANDTDCLLAAGCTHVLNMTRHHIEDKVRNNFKYLQLALSDKPTTNIAEHFDKAFRFIDEARESNGIVLVHCRAGVSRSCTITLGYLLIREGWSLKEAYAHVRERRTVAHPNRGFMSTLMEFERQMKGEISLTFDDLPHSLFERMMMLQVQDPVPDNDFLYEMELKASKAYKERYGVANTEMSLDAGFSGKMGLHFVELYTVNDFEWMDEIIINSLLEYRRKHNQYMPPINWNIVACSRSAIEMSQTTSTTSNGSQQQQHMQASMTVLSANNHSTSLTQITMSK